MLLFVERGYQGKDATPSMLLYCTARGLPWGPTCCLAVLRCAQAEAARRDHRRLGQELDLFSINDTAGGGLVFWHPKGGTVGAPGPVGAAVGSTCVLWWW